MLEAGLCSYLDLFLGAEGLSEGMRLPCWRLVCVATLDLFLGAEGVA